MCIIVFEYRPEAKSGYRLVLAANRDEFLHRATLPAAPWEDGVVIAGRDADPTRPPNGSWLGVSRHGRIAALTNVREPAPAPPADSRGRGELVNRVLTTTDAEVAAVMAGIHRQGEDYGGFNLLAFDMLQPAAHCATNRGDLPQSFAPNPVLTEVDSGVHVLTNGLLNSPWAKAERLREAYHDVRAELWDTKSVDDSIRLLLPLLSDTTRAHPSNLPGTGLPESIELPLSSVFIPHGPLGSMGAYGTRAQTIVMVDADNQLTFYERAWQPSGDWLEYSTTVQIEPLPAAVP